MSDIVIRVVNVDPVVVPLASGKGSYTRLEVAHKTVYAGQEKLDVKKLMSFACDKVPASKQMYAELLKASKGAVFTISRVKNEAGYWDWVSAVAGEGDEPQISPVAVSDVKAASTATFSRNTYETPEERKARQRSIERQSCLAKAVELAIAQKKLDIPYIFDVAEQFVRFVNDTEIPVVLPEANEAQVD